MTLALEDFQKKMDETLNSITNSFTSMDKNLYKGGNDQQTLLKNDCKKILTDCNNRVGETKDSVLDFLKPCNEQNLELIKKIPEQKRKFQLAGSSGLCHVRSVHYRDGGAEGRGRT